MRTKLYLIALTVLAVLAAASVILFMKPKRQLVISLSYKEATQGLAPDGKYFRMSEIVSDDVLAKLEAKTGIPAEELRENLTVMADTDSDYTYTTYRAEYNTTMHSEKEKVRVLEALGDVFCEDFRAKHGANMTALTLRDTDETEYILLRDHYRSEAYRLLRYVDKLAAKTPKYKNKEGHTFTELKEKTQALIDNTIGNCSAYLIETGTAEENER